MGAPRLWKTLAAVGFIAAGLASYPAKDQFDPYECRIEGLWGHISASLYGQMFWRRQLDFVHATAADHEGAPKRQERLDEMIARAEAVAQAHIEKTYQQNPAMAPTPLGERAIALRKEADRIQLLEGNLILQEWNASAAQTTRACEAQLRADHGM